MQSNAMRLSHTSMCDNHTMLTQIASNIHTSTKHLQMYTK